MMMKYIRFNYTESHKLSMKKCYYAIRTAKQIVESYKKKLPTTITNVLEPRVYIN